MYWLLFVQKTNKGFLHFYDIVSSNENATRMFSYQFHTPHHYVAGPGERYGCPSKSIRFKMALEIDTGIQWYIHVHQSN